MQALGREHDAESVHHMRSRMSLMVLRVILADKKIAEPATKTPTPAAEAS